MEDLSITIAKDFCTSPGGRWKDLGHNSGEEFYNTLLLPLYEKSIRTSQKLHIYLDGVHAYPYSFLDQSFGELGRLKGVDQVYSIIVLHSEVFKWVKDFIISNIWLKKDSL